MGPWNSHPGARRPEQVACRARLRPARLQRQPLGRGHRGRARVRPGGCLKALASNNIPSLIACSIRPLAVAPTDDGRRATGLAAGHQAREAPAMPRLPATPVRGRGATMGCGGRRDGKGPMFAHPIPCTRCAPFDVGYFNSSGSGVDTSPVAAHSVPRVNVATNPAPVIASESWPSAVTNTRPLP
jgi:hypothetical protein